MTRQFWVIVHRYAGLYMAAFLVVAGLTGSIMAFEPQIDAWLNPPIRVAANGRAPLDPVVLYDRMVAAEPRCRPAGNVVLGGTPPGEAIGYWCDPRIDARTGQPEHLDFSYLMMDPYTGAVLERGVYPLSWFPLTRKSFLPFIVTLHFTLAIPGSLGVWLFGIAALVWTLDCFVSAYLTFPVTARQVRSTPPDRRPSTPAARAWWARWWNPSWLIAWRGSAFRINFDLHRAGGLWLWVMLGALAWSSVGFNLPQVYGPVMHTLFRNQDPSTAITETPSKRTTPPMGWPQAREVGRRLMAEESRRNGFAVESEMFLSYEPDRNLITYTVRSNRDLTDRGGATRVAFDGSTGSLVSMVIPRGQNAGTTLDSWIFALHTAGVWGNPYRIFLAIVGIVITVLSGTGVYIWWRKLSARRWSRSRIARRRRESAFDATSVAKSGVVCD